MTDNSALKNKTAACFTLGCKLNFAETSAIGKMLNEQGVRKAKSGEKADICIVNTCTVTKAADKKCRQAIRRIAKRHPGALMVVTGCYAQSKPEEVARIEGVDVVLGVKQKQDILKHLQRRTASSPVAAITSPAKDIRTFVPSCSAGDRTRHFLKVQDGCDYFCTYCIVPFARGRSRNGSIASMVTLAKEVAEAGGKEIVLTGANTGDFGKSTGETFIDLIRALDAVEGIARYRISSIEPNLITDAIIAFVADSKRFVRHFHIPLQSGSDSVLQIMRRKYDTALFRYKIEKIRERMPDAFIGIDVIAGMRGETEAMFEEGRAFIAALDVSQLHVFAYSERPGTQALNIPHAVAPQTKRLRSKQLQDISDAKWRAFYDRHIGKDAGVLFEHTGKGNRMHGFTENYIRVETPYRAALINKVCRVTLAGWNGDRSALTCQLADDAE
ncbi:MAG: tRNA (N(6)-L-threonylcarbamoyladenosine(37)-C(2))-methylthiotran sferase MtaB [Bacteroidales bacterium]